jgi:phosphatidylserine/phosphatidylglycerophosphate/cardiolipin synthase-like enzyme
MRSNPRATSFVTGIGDKSLRLYASSVTARLPAHRATTYARSMTGADSLTRTAKVTLLADRAHYDRLVTKVIASAKTSIWIGTANVKELRIEAPIGSTARARGRYVSILDTFASLVRAGVEIRLLHAAAPSRPFRAELGRQRTLAKNARFSIRQCPRVHLKMIAVDGAALYLGSANFTGAGLGAKGDGRRNFEMGILTDDDVLLDAAQARFERIWSGAECGACRLRSVCPKPLDTR